MTLFNIFINNLGNSLIKLANEMKLERSVNMSVLEDIWIQDYLVKSQ